MSSKSWKYYTVSYISIAVITAVLIFVQGMRIQKSQQDAVSSNKDLTKSMENLSASNEKLVKNLAPILEIAKERFPNLPPSEALEKLQNEMQQLETRTSSLEQKTTFRTLTPEQNTKLIKTLSLYQKHKISIHSDPDPESRQFAGLFKKVFKEAGWIISNDIIELGYPNREFCSFGIIIASAEAYPKDANMLYKLFQTIGFQTELVILTDFKSDEVKLMICAWQ